MPWGMTHVRARVLLGSDAATAEDTATAAASSRAVARHTARVAGRSDDHGVCDVVTTSGCAPTAPRRATTAGSGPCTWTTS